MAAEGLRVGIVGAGFMAQVHAESLVAMDACLAGFASRAEDVLDDVTARFGGRAYGSFDELVGDVDVVDVCAPTHLHHDLVLAAAAAGRHVICEKPLARTPEQARQMIAACERAGVHLLVAHVVRFFPEYAAARAAVAAGELGEPAVVRLARLTSGPRKAQDNWFVEEEKSGGMVLDLMVHDFDYARWVAGDVASAYAKGFAAPGEAGLARHVLALLRHASGAISHIEGSWAYPLPTFLTRGEIAGASGLLSWDSTETAPVRTALAGDGAAVGEVLLPESPVRESPYTTQLRHFLRVLEGGETPIVTAADGLAALEVAEAVAESLRTGAPVELAGAGARPAEVGA
ncbi:MAG TPA: Gfo/Idh/MocA family oxidoreductase [Egibacteraceae bacterium]|nr:Gfo/Idh/MocA family oxidoreductase [Egibacteraceae bacterium]